MPWPDYLPDTDELRNKLRGLLGDMPLTQIMRGEASMPTAQGLREGLLSMKPFDSSQGAQGAYEAGLNALNPMLAAKIVYHGSPHKFDKFDASKIGTGEGAQAYGHGVYLADAPEVAKGYAKPLHEYTAATQYWTHNADQSKLSKPALEWLEYISTQKGELPSKLLSRYVKKGEIPQNVGEELSSVQWGKPIDEKFVYKADLPDEWIPKMLDYDLPVNKQLPVVQEWARKMLKGKGYLRPNDNGPRQLKRSWDAFMLEHGGMIKPKGGEGIYEQMAKDFGSPDAASGYLRDAGIPGIRYLDGGSRAKGQGSYNYVVFPGLEDQVKILERNGVPINKLRGLLGK